MVQIDRYKWLFAAVSSAISFLVGRKFATLNQQLNNCETSVRDRFVNNNVEIKHLRENIITLQTRNNNLVP